MSKSSVYSLHEEINIPRVAVYLVLCQVFLIPGFYAIDYAYAQPPSNQTSVIQSGRVNVEDKWSFALLILTISIVVVSIAVFVASQIQHKRQHGREVADTLQIILKELQENKKTLLGSAHERIEYTSRDHEANVRNIGYVNAYLESDAYDSIVQSGLIKHLRIDMQSRLNMLYSRIRSRNKLITYTEHFEDLFFLYDESKDRLNSWYKKIEKYDILLTWWEHEIIDLIDDIQVQLKKEKPKSYQYNKNLFRIRS